MNSSEYEVGYIGKHNRTVGRLSYLARLPIAFVCTIAQAMKIAGKAIFTPWSYTDSGELKYDILGLRDLTLSIGRAAKRVVVAPEKTDPNFVTGLKITKAIVTGQFTYQMKGRYDRMLGISSDNASRYSNLSQ